MIKTCFRGTEADAWRIVGVAPTVRLVGIADGRAVARTVHGIVIDDQIAFHGGDHGEKLGLLDKPVTVGAERIIAEIPSYFVDPERACPATTYYESAELAGVLERVDDLEFKRRVLEHLMPRFQPEGGYVPFIDNDDLYRKAVASLLVARVRPTSITSKIKLGQNRHRQQIERVLCGLWTRGRGGDLTAIERIRAAHPAKPRPRFLDCPDETTLHVAPSADDAEQVGRLLYGAYWTTGSGISRLAQSQLNSSAWLVLKARDGRVLASGRANSDGLRRAGIYDIIVHPNARGRGLGKLIVERLLDHPALRNVERISLGTRDAHGLYERFGFERVAGNDRLMIRAA